MPPTPAFLDSLRGLPLLEAQARVIEYGFQPVGPFRFASDPPVDRSRAVYLTLDPVFTEPKKAFVLFAKAEPPSPQ